VAKSSAPGPAHPSGRRCPRRALPRPRLGGSQRHGHRGGGADRQSLCGGLPGFALTYAIAKRVVTVPHVAMANLIAGKRVVPELIQHDFTAANIVQQLERLLPDGPPRESMMEELKRDSGLLPWPGHGGRKAAAPSNGWRRLPLLNLAPLPRRGFPRLCNPETVSPAFGLEPAKTDSIMKENGCKTGAMR
jgi:hypothetical protein